MRTDKSIEEFMKELDRIEAAGELPDDKPAFYNVSLSYVAYWYNIHQKLVAAISVVEQIALRLHLV